jgi:hypothetical protein
MLPDIPKLDRYFDLAEHVALRFSLLVFFGVGALPRYREGVEEKIRAASRRCDLCRSLMRLFKAVLFVLPLCALAQEQPKCPKGFQPYGGRCVSQRMSDYIACVESSGANHQEMTEEVNVVANKQLSGEAKGSGSGVAVKGSGSIALSSKSEQELVKKIQQKWYSDAMKECAKALDRPVRKPSQSPNSINVGPDSNVQIGHDNTNNTYIYKRQQDDWLVLAQQGIDLGQKLTTLGETFYQQWKDATPKCNARICTTAISFTSISSLRLTLSATISGIFTKS